MGYLPQQKTHNFEDLPAMDIAHTGKTFTFFTHVKGDKVIICESVEKLEDAQYIGHNGKGKFGHCIAVNRSEFEEAFKMKF